MLYHPPIPHDLQNSEIITERPQEPEVAEVYSEAVFSSHRTHAFAAVVAACTNAQTRPVKG